MASACNFLQPSLRATTGVAARDLRQHRLVHRQFIGSQRQSM